MEQVVELALDAVRNHRIQESVYHLKCIAETYRNESVGGGGEEGGRLSKASPGKTIELLKEGLGSQALVNHSEGGGSILRCLSEYLASVSGADTDRVRSETSATTSDYASQWKADKLCKQVLRYHVKTLFFMVKSGNTEKQVEVMRVFKSMCKLGEWTAVEMMKRVDWAKMIDKCKGYSMGRRELSRLRAKKRRRSEVEKEGELGNAVEQDDGKRKDGDVVASARDAYVDFMVTVIELDQGDVWDLVCLRPVLFRALFTGFLTEGGAKNLKRVAGALRTHLFGGKHWSDFSMMKRHKLFQHQHLRLLCAAMDVHPGEAHGISEILLQLFARGKGQTLFPVSDRDFVLCMMSADDPKKVEGQSCLQETLRSSQYKSLENMVSSMKAYAFVVNKSLKYSRNLNHARWFKDLLVRDPLMGTFVFMHWKPNASQHRSVIHFVATESFVVWMSRMSLVLQALSGLRSVYRVIGSTVLRSGSDLGDDFDFDSFVESCLSAIVLPSAVVEKNAIMKSLQAGILHDNTLAVHKLLQLCHVLQENCSSFLALVQDSKAAHSAWTNALRTKMLTLLPDLKFLVAIHVHFRDQLYHKEEQKNNLSSKTAAPDCGGKVQASTSPEAEGGDRGQPRTMELVLLQSLRCQRSLGEMYTSFGFSWAESASKCVSDGLLNYSQRHKVELLDFLQLAAATDSEVTYSWKTLSMLFHMLLDAGAPNERISSLSRSAENLVIKLLLNTHLFEAYPAEVGIWVQNVKLCKASGKDPAKTSLIIDFLCRAVFQAVGKVTDFVFFLQSLSSDRPNGSKTEGARFGPLILLVVQQCCSFVSSQKRPDEEKAAIAEYVSSVARDLICLYEHSTTFLREAIAKLVQDAKDGNPGSPACLESHMGQVLELCTGGKQEGFLQQKLSASATCLHCHGESLHLLSFFNFITMASESLTNENWMVQVSVLASLNTLLDGVPVPARSVLPPQWFATLSKLIECFGPSIRKQDKGSAILSTHAISLIQKLGAFSKPLGLKASQDCERLLARVSLLVLESFESLKGERFLLEGVQSNLLLEVLVNILSMKEPNDACVSFFVDLLDRGGDRSENEEKGEGEVRFQLRILHLMLNGCSKAGKDCVATGWQRDFMLGVISSISHGLAQSSRSRKEHSATFFCLLAEMQPVVALDTTFYEFMFKSLIETKGGSKTFECITRILAHRPAAMRVAIEGDKGFKRYMRELETPHFAKLCGPLEMYSRTISASAQVSGSDNSKIEGNHRKIASLCFERSLSHLFSMDSDPAGAKAMANLVQTLAKGSDFFLLDVEKGLKRCKESKARIAERNATALLPPMLSAICGLKRIVPKEEQSDFALFLLGFFEQHGVHRAIMHVSRSKSKSKDDASLGFLSDVLDVFCFLLEACPESAKVAPIMRDFMPVIVKSAFGDGRMLRHLAEFGTKMHAIFRDSAAQGMEESKSGWFVQYTTELVDLLISHSRFKTMLFDDQEGSSPRRGENRTCMGSILTSGLSIECTPEKPPQGCRKDLFRALEELLSIGNLFALYESEEGKRQCQQLHSMLLSAYGCRTSPGDSSLLQLMKTLAKQGRGGVESFRHHQFLWGDAFRRYYMCTLQGGGDQETALKSIVLNVQLPQIRVDTLARTIHYILGDSAYAGDSYDPWFLLSFVKHHVESGTLDYEASIFKGFLSLSLAGLSSSLPGLAKASFEALEAYCGPSVSLDFKGGKLVGDLLKKARAMATETEREDGRIPAPATVLASELVLCLVHESNFMHATAKKLLGRESTFDASNIPVFLDLLHTSSPDYVRYQSWLLRYLHVSLSHEADFGPFRKRFAFEVLMGFATAAFSDLEIVKAILLLLKKASGFEKFAYQLVYKRNVLPWLIGLLQTEGRAAARSSVLLVATLDTMLSFLRMATKLQWAVGLSVCNDVSSLALRLREDGAPEAAAKVLDDILAEVSRVPGREVVREER
ncbi:NopRA1 domain-containing protein [Chloropicon primus]|nr:NopRA1 domain-containing protein [Chloropicon primus]